MSMSRIRYLDLARGLAILFMFTQHCMLVHEVHGGDGDHPLSIIFTLLGTAPAAPVFMMIMGAFLMASKAPLKKQVIRGIHLFFLGYALNLLRFPMFLEDGLSGVSCLYQTIVKIMHVVDILQLAGLAFILGAFLKQWMNHRIWPLLIMLVVLLISPMLWGKWGSTGPGILFYGVSENVAFPFFPWIVYPLSGMYLSRCLLDTERIQHHLKILSIIGAALIVTGLLLLDFFPIGDYSRSGLAIHLIIFGFVFIWLKGCYWVSTRVSEHNAVINVFNFWSQNITAVYFIQWILFSWSVFIFGGNARNAWEAAAIGAMAAVLTHHLVKLKSIQKCFKGV